MNRRRALWLFGLGQAALLVPMARLERRMKRTGGPGIIPFELAGTEELSQRILDKWGEEGQAAAKRSLVLDFPYLVTYVGLQVIGCTAASEELDRRGASRLAAAGRVIAPSQVAAGAFDAAENASLLGVLAGRRGRLPQLARAFASAKFALLTLGWLYAALGAASRVAPGRG